jgi:hypothetical protein
VGALACKLTALHTLKYKLVIELFIGAFHADILRREQDLFTNSKVLGQIVTIIVFYLKLLASDSQYSIRHLGHCSAVLPRCGTRVRGICIINLFILAWSPGGAPAPSIIKNINQSTQFINKQFYMNYLTVISPVCRLKKLFSYYSII